MYVNLYFKIRLFTPFTLDKKKFENFYLPFFLIIIIKLKKFNGIDLSLLNIQHFHYHDVSHLNLHVLDDELPDVDVDYFQISLIINLLNVFSMKSRGGRLAGIL